MKSFPQDCSQLLPKLGADLQAAPPDRANELVFHTASLLILAGYGEAAYEALSALLDEPLQLSPASALMATYQKTVFPSLSYALGLPCPAIADQPQMVGDPLTRFIQTQERENRSFLLFDRFSIGPEILFPSSVASPIEPNSLVSDCTDAEIQAGIQRMLAQGDDSQEQPSDREVFSFLQKMYQRIQTHGRQGEFSEAIALAQQYDQICVARHLPGQDWISKDVRKIAIDACFQIGEIDQAKAWLKAWWHSQPAPSDLGLFSFTAIIQAFLEGTLRSEINLPPEHVADFLTILRHYAKPTPSSMTSSIADWEALLEAWGKVIFEHLPESERETYASYFPEAIHRQTCRQPSATEVEIHALEQRLGRSLPPSYRTFLGYSNGWAMVNLFSRLFSTQEVDWFYHLNQEWVDVWNQIESEDVSDDLYFQYGEHQDCCQIRNRYLKTALQISTDEDGYVFLLNPMVTDERGEWEAWDFGTKYPGAYRYRSFWEMMQAVYQRSLDELQAP